MTNDKALEAARAAYRKAEENPRFVECPRCKGVGYHHGFGEDGNDPDWCSQCGGSQQIMPADEADRPLIEAISAYLSALPGEAEVSGYLFRLRYGQDRWSHQLMFSDTLPKEGDAKEIEPLVTLASLQAMQARVKELEEALAYAAKGLDMIHNGLMDPTRPRQSVGEVCAHFLSTALSKGGSYG